jgi:deoxyribose-phosphate aldolase
VLFESSYFGEDHKVILTKMSKRVGAAFISTNNVADVPLLKRIGRDFIKPKLTGANLDQFKAGYAAGAERFTSSSAILIAAQWKAELAAAAEASS